MKPKFTIRDLFWLVFVVAVGCASGRQLSLAIIDDMSGDFRVVSVDGERPPRAPPRPSIHTWVPMVCLTPGTHTIRVKENWQSDAEAVEFTFTVETDRHYRVTRTADGDPTLVAE